MSKVASSTTILGFLGRSQSLLLEVYMTIKYHVQVLIYMCSKIGIVGKLASREGLRLKKDLKRSFYPIKAPPEPKTSEITVFGHKIYYKKLKILKK